MTITELKNRYSNIEKIKKGGQKIVYKACENGIYVALKIINDVNDSRVLQEIDVVKNLNIDNIPKIIESGIVLDESINENVLYIVEQYIDGISLRDWLNQGNTFDLLQAIKVVDTLISIEVKLENEKILHRDINPNNIIMETSGNIFLIDFGLAKILNGMSLTRTAALYGPYTPGYAPHEQFANIKNAQDVRTDLFQIGVTIYESCTGVNPFIQSEDNIYQVLSRTINFNPLPLNLIGDNHGMFSQFISMLMAKSQSQRPNTALDAMRYLNAIKSDLELEY